ncbi:cell wall protein [Colletotrichum truncatum]|uniref:Cell wall protein n=1 Tax=Colletotrichum truncatum TaxID=5467 RepID=A0ACC3ZH50_COLTU|nr:cell wall protein [Colletotrichum truncatum]KAF6784660.1 cell wall protein [Colletotrichum truncatum]
MKFTTEITLLTMAAGVFAEAPTRVQRDTPSLVERDLATISGVIQQVDNQLKSLNTAVQGFNGDINGLATAAGGLVNTLQQGTQQVDATSEITLNEALNLQQFVTGLQTDGNALIKGLNDKKPEFEKANLCGVIVTNVEQTGASAQKLIDAVVKKVPQSVQQVASQLAGSFSKSLTDAKDNFAPGKCNNANGSGGAAGSNSTMPRTSSPAKAGAGSLYVSAGAIAVAAFASLLL